MFFSSSTMRIVAMPARPAKHGARGHVHASASCTLQCAGVRIARRVSARGRLRPMIRAPPGGHGSCFARGYVAGDDRPAHVRHTRGAVRPERMVAPSPGPAPRAEGYRHGGPAAQDRGPPGARGPPTVTASPPLAAPASTPRRPQIIVVTTAMLVFISFWRAAAIVLCDLASTAYYIGGIVEQAVGKAAPWYIFGVMLFSYAVRGVYIESCAMFVRGGVYRVVKEAMGGTLAKVSVSALMFDYVLTGRIRGVSAGQHSVGLANDRRGRVL